MLVGAPKLGKSWMSLNIGCAVATGGRAFGSIDVDSGDVLYLALEDNGRRLQRRLGMVLGGGPGPERLHLATSLDPIAEGGAEQIRTWLDSRAGARLVIIDVLARVRSRRGSDTSIYDADYHAVAELKRIADQNDVAVIVVHHTRKSVAEDFLETVSGSNGLAGAADGIAVLQRSRGKASATLKVTGRDVEEVEIAMDFDAASGTWSTLDGPAVDHTLGKTRADLMALVRERVVVSTRDAYEALPDVKPGTIRQTLRRMVEDNQIADDGCGNYLEIDVERVTAVTESQQPVTALQKLHLRSATGS